jgi:hypothetical protein
MDKTRLVLVVDRIGVNCGLIHAAATRYGLEGDLI